MHFYPWDFKGFVKKIEILIQILHFSKDRMHTPPE